MSGSVSNTSVPATSSLGRITSPPADGDGESGRKASTQRMNARSLSKTLLTFLREERSSNCCWISARAWNVLLAC